MTDIEPLAYKSFDTPAIPDALNQARLPTRDETMAQIFAHRREVQLAEMRSGFEEEEPARRRERRPRIEDAPVHLPQRQELDVGGQRLNVTQDDIHRLARQALAFPQVAVAVRHAAAQDEQQRALATIGSEYGDIFQDLTASQFAAFKLAELRRQDAALGIERDTLGAYREACNRVRSALHTAPPPRPGQRRTAAPAVPESRGSSVVAQMRRERGQL